MIEDNKINGHIEIYRVRDGVRSLVYEKKNTIGAGLQTRLRDAVMSRSLDAGLDAMAWGSFKAPAGSFIDSDYAGTTSSGTTGGLSQASSGSISVIYGGTFTFSTTKNINWFALGRGYTAAGAGVGSLFTTGYAYDSSLLTGSTYVTYLNGDSLIVRWTVQMGS